LIVVPASAIRQVRRANPRLSGVLVASTMSTASWTCSARPLPSVTLESPERTCPLRNRCAAASAVPGLADQLMASERPKTQALLRAEEVSCGRGAPRRDSLRKHRRHRVAYDTSHLPSPISSTALTRPPATLSQW
jgi:hypothetical protein